MLRIDATTLKKMIISENLLIEGIIPPIESKFVTEFRVKNKFYYSVQNNPELLLAQNKIISDILSKVELNNSAFAFIKNKSYLDFFEPHMGNYNFVRIDIQNFFHSIHTPQLKEILSHYFKDEFIDPNKKQKIISSFMNLITFNIPLSSKNQNSKNNNILPIGFTTSPIISNIYMRDFDIKMQDFCIRHNITYSRYADDMLFSSTEQSSFVLSDAFMKEVSILLNLKKLKINTSKTIKKKHTISLNGYTISSSLIVDGKVISPAEFRISNKKTAIIRKFILLSKKEKITSRYIMEKLFHFDKNKVHFLFPPKDKFIESYCNTLLVNKIKGYRSYIISLIKNAKKYNNTNENTIKKYQEIILELNIYLDKNPLKNFSENKKT